MASIDPTKLPSTASGVASILAKLPATLGGHPVTARTGREVSYADGTSIHAQPLAEAAGPGMAMAQFFAGFVRQGGQFTVTSQNKPDEPMLWFTANGRPPYGAHVAALASSTGSWLFGVDAPSERAANDLLTRFEAALP